MAVTSEKVRELAERQYWPEWATRWVWLEFIGHIEIEGATVGLLYPGQKMPLGHCDLAHLGATRGSEDPEWGEDPWLTAFPVFSDALAPSLRGYFPGLEVTAVLLRLCLKTPCPVLIPSRLHNSLYHTSVFLKEKKIYNKMCFTLLHCIILRNVLFVNAWSDISVQFGDMSSKARTVSIFITDILRVDRWILYTRLHHDFCLIFECF